MNKSPNKNNRLSGRRGDSPQLAPGQWLRQLGIILIVLLVWLGLLVGYLGLTGDAGQEQQAQTEPPVAATSAPAGTATHTPQPEATEAGVAPTDVPATEEPTTEPTETVSPPTPTEAASPTAAAAAGPSFAGDVLPVFESRCVRCHGADRVEGGLVLNSYASLMAGSESGQVVIPGDAASSYLVELIVSGEMPRRGPTLLPAEIDAIRAWIDAGALDN